MLLNTIFLQTIAIFSVMLPISCSRRQFKAEYLKLTNDDRLYSSVPDLRPDNNFFQEAVESSEPRNLRRCLSLSNKKDEDLIDLDERHPYLNIRNIFFESLLKDTTWLIDPIQDRNFFVADFFPKLCRRIA